MQLQDIIMAAQFKISEGSEYQWSCYGKNARFLDFQSDFEHVNVSCVFDSKNQIVYEATLYLDNKLYRWLNPDFADAMKNESFERDIDPRVFLENIYFSDCEVFENLIEKIKDAFESGSCTHDIVIPFSLTPEQEKLFSRLPEGTDLNSLIVQSLLDTIAKLQARNQQNWDTLKKNLKEKGITVKVNEVNAVLPQVQIASLQKEIEKSGLKRVQLNYSNKLTKNGLIFSLVNKSFTFKYKVEPRI